MEAFGDKSKKEAEERLAKEQELLKVQVKKEDIDLIVCFGFLTLVLLLNLYI